MTNGEEKFLRQLLDERADRLKQLIDERFKAHRREHDMLGEAIKKADSDNERRLLVLNDLRSEVTEDRGRLVERVLFDAQMEVVRRDIAMAMERLTRVETRVLTGAILLSGGMPIFGVFLAWWLRS